jgi:hypothetical protein
VFEKHERETRTLTELRQELSKELATLKRTVSGIEQRLEQVGQHQSETGAHLAGQVKTLTNSESQLRDRIESFDRFITCPRCGVVLDLDKVSTSGGLLRKAGKRCPFCEAQGSFNDIPLLSAKKAGDERK